VLVNDTLTYSARVTQKADSRSRPEIGLVFTQIEAVNQRGELVFSVVSKVFVERRSRFAG
jgi:acyl dehydratase